MEPVPDRPVVYSVTVCSRLEVDKRCRGRACIIFDVLNGACIILQKKLN